MDNGMVVFTYSWNQLLIGGLILIGIILFLFYGVWQIIDDNERLRHENKKLSDKNRELESQARQK